MHLETYDKFFSFGKVLCAISIVCLISVVIICASVELPADCIIILFLGGYLILSAICLPLSIHIRENMLRKRIDNDRVTLLPEIKLEYGDFDDGQSWIIVKRQRMYGNYDKNGITDFNLMNRAGKYLLTDWCSYIMKTDIPDNLNPSRLYVLCYHDDETRNLVYCHGHNMRQADIVFDEPVKEFGNLTNEYIKVVFTDGSVNYVKLENGDIMFSENLPGGFGVIEK